MRIASPSRRALGAFAVSAIGMSTAVLGVTGVAQATDTVHITADTSVMVPTGKCGALVTLTSGSGATIGGHAGGLGEFFTFDLYTGPSSGTLAFGIGHAASGATGGVGGAGSNGGNGGTGGGGGGGGTSVSVNGTLAVVVAGGGGAGASSAGGDSNNGGAGYDAVGQDGNTYQYNGGDQGVGSPGGGGTTLDLSGTNGGAANGKVGGTGGGPGAGGGGGGGFGGGGGASDGTSGAGGGGGGGEYGQAYSGGDKVSTENSGAASGPGAGSADYTWIDCVAPSAPFVQDFQAGETSVVFHLHAGEQADMDTSAMTYQYKLDDGSWTTLPTTHDSANDYDVATISGLTTGTDYSVRFRNVSANGDGDPSDPETVTPYHTMSAPVNVTATPKASSVLVTWEPPADAVGVSGYYVKAIPGTDHDAVGEYYECSRQLEAADRSCLIGVRAGVPYSVTVWAANQGPSEPAYVQTSEVNAASVPSSVPVADGPLKTPKGAVSSVAAGSKVTLTGSGYLPGSTITLVIYSSPTVLGTVQADANGNFSYAVTVPAGFGGSHSLVASGVDASGQPRNLRMNVTVARPANELAYTGASVLTPALAGLGALVLGGGLLMVSRRRSPR